MPKREIELSKLAEKRLAALFVRIWHLARLAAEKVLDQGRAAIRRAIETTLRSSAVMMEIRRIARTIETGLRRQIAKVTGERIPKSEDQIGSVETEWTKETLAELRSLLVGGSIKKESLSDSFGLLGRRSMALLEIAVRAADTAESLVGAKAELERRASKAVHSVKTAAKAKARNYASRANKSLQKAIGAERYIWRTMQDDLVRPAHQDLNDTLQRWDDPPVAEANGDRYHPGEMHNCRCIAIPAR